MLQDNNPDAACMYDIYIYIRMKGSVGSCCDLGSTPIELYKCPTTCWLAAPASSVCLLALSRSDRHELALLLCAGLTTLCCAVLAVDAQRQHACSSRWVRFCDLSRRSRSENNCVRTNQQTSSKRIQKKRQKKIKIIKNKK